MNEKESGKEELIPKEASDENKDESVQEESTAKGGDVSRWLTSQGLEHTALDPDHLGIEVIESKAEDLKSIVNSLKENGFDYLQCQGGYDEGPGQRLVCFYNLISINDYINKKSSSGNINPREVRIKVFLDRSGPLNVPSLYGIYRGSDWQERETYDMFGINFLGHPHPKRLLMPEDWKGWPLRKDYVQPDFYEMQDAY